MRKSWLYVGIAVIVVAVVLRVAFLKRGGERDRPETRAAVEVMRVHKDTVRATTELLGTILADKTAQVFPEVMGRVKQILVREGTAVAKDTKLLLIRNETVGFEYEEAAIRSPIAGRVATILVGVGTMVTPQTPVALVVDFSTMKASFSVPEIDAATVRRDGVVDITVDAVPNESFAGRITEVSPVVDPMTHTIAVKATIKTARPEVKPGMTARVRLRLGERKNVLAIPKDALVNEYVFVVKDSMVERRNVQIGLVGDETVQVITGVSENEMVVVLGQERLAGGEKVVPILRSRQ